MSRKGSLNVLPQPLCSTCSNGRNVLTCHFPYKQKMPRPIGINSSATNPLHVRQFSSERDKPTKRERHHSSIDATIPCTGRIGSHCSASACQYSHATTTIKNTPCGWVRAARPPHSPDNHQRCSRA